MIVLETNDPNFVVKRDIHLKTESGNSIELFEGEFVEINKLESGDFCLSNCCVISKEMKDKLFESLNNISHIQVEDIETDDLNVDGKVLKEYVNDSFNEKDFQFRLIENKDIILNDLYRIVSIN